MRLCDIEGCDGKYEALGYCQKHYRRFKKYGDPLFVRLKKPNEKHGMFKTPEYRIWKGMNNRCYTTSNSSYKYYGKLGITVCDRWRHDFLNFYSDMGKRPSSNHQLDRTKNHLGYSPNNCTWLLQVDNVRKQAKCRLSMEKAEEIRAKYSKGATLKILANEYNCSMYPIWSAVKGKSWM